jgi:hypothetical protein
MGNESETHWMPVFAVIAPKEDARLTAAVSANFPRRYKIAPGQWVVNADGPTAQSVATRLGLNNTVGSFVVFSVAGYFGYHDKPLWEWLTLNSN